MKLDNKGWFAVCIPFLSQNGLVSALGRPVISIHIKFGKTYTMNHASCMGPLAIATVFPPTLRLELWVFHTAISRNTIPRSDQGSESFSMT